MSRTLTASDRRRLIRLASSMEKGSEERRAILAGLSKSSDLRESDWEDFKDHFERGREDEWFKRNAPMTKGFVRSALVEQVARDPEVSAKKLQRIYESGQRAEWWQV